MVSICCQALHQLVTARLLNLVASTRRTLGVSAALVRFIHDDEIPALLPNPLAYILLLRVVQRCDYLRCALPGVHELLLVNGGEDNLERFAKPPQQLVLPLDRQRSGAKNEYSLNGFAQFHLLKEKTRHDRLARTGIIRKQEPEPRLRQHLHIHCFDLVRQGADTRKTHGKLPIVSVGQADTGGLDEQTQLFCVCRPDCRRRNDSLASKGSPFFQRKDGLVWRSIR